MLTSSKDAQEQWARWVRGRVVVWVVEAFKIYIWDEIFKT